MFKSTGCEQVLAAQTPVFPANIWKPGLEPINIERRGAKRDPTPVTAAIKKRLAAGCALDAIKFRKWRRQDVDTARQSLERAER
jgi:hypothetical protein